MEEKTWFAGRQVGLSGGREQLKSAGDQKAEQNSAGGFCRQANKDISTKH